MELDRCAMVALTALFKLCPFEVQVNVCVFVIVTVGWVGLSWFRHRTCHPTLDLFVAPRSVHRTEEASQTDVVWMEME